MILIDLEKAYTTEMDLLWWSLKKKGIPEHVAIIRTCRHIMIIYSDESETRCDATYYVDVEVGLHHGLL